MPRGQAFDSRSVVGAEDSNGEVARLMIALLLLVIWSPMIRNESCDMIELHHMHDIEGRRSFDQVIFWDWDERRNEYHVRAWRIVQGDEMPVQRGQRWYISYHDQNIRRSFVSSHYRETWLQRDPEREDKREHPECMRVALRR